MIEEVNFRGRRRIISKTNDERLKMKKSPMKWGKMKISQI